MDQILETERRELLKPNPWRQIMEGIVDDEDMVAEDGTPPDIDDSPEPKNDAVPGEVPAELEERPDADGIVD